MKWILVWWMIHPGHAQVIHMEGGFADEDACTAYAESLPGEKSESKYVGPHAQQTPGKKGTIRWHCSME